MKISKQNILILISPFLLMIIINEMSRPFIDGKPYSKSVSGALFTSMNPVAFYTDKCSWSCHNNTIKCMDKHVKFIKPGFLFYNVINRTYYGMIGLLMSGGSGASYALLNIIFLVILWPFLIFFLFVRIIRLKKEIRLKNSSE